MNVSVNILNLAKKENNWLGPAASWDALDDHKFTCAASKRWFLYGGVVKRDASQTISVYLKDSSDNILQLLLSETASTALVHYPETDFFLASALPLIVDAGEYVHFEFGGNQGAGGYISAVVLEIDV